MQAPDFSQSFNRFSYCWNNPLKYTDPSGEIIDLVLFLGGSFLLGGAFFGQQSDGTFDWGEAVKGGLGSMLIAGTMLASTALPALIPAAPGALPGFMLGAGYFTSTAINTGSWNWLITGTFAPDWFASLMSAVPGILMGIEGGIKSMKYGGDFLTGDGMVFELSGDFNYENNGKFAFANDQELENYLKQHINYDDFGLLEVTAYKDPYNLKIGGDYYYVRDPQNGIIFKFQKNQMITGTPIGGFTVSEKSGFFSLKSRIYMSRFSDISYFSGVLNHELIHAYHISLGFRSWGLSSYQGYSERIAYEYSFSIGQTSWQKVKSYYPGPRTYIMPPYLLPIP